MKDVDAQITFGDVGVRVGLRDFRDDVHCCERRVATLVRVERTDTDEAMHALLVHQEAIGVWSSDNKCTALDACLLALHVVCDEYLEPLSFGVTGIHTHEHFGPILCICSARSARE